MNWKKELLQVREKWYLEKYVAARDHGVPLAKPYRDTDTSSLIRAVFDWLKFNNHYVNRTNAEGRVYIEKVQCVGKVIEHVRHTPSTTNKGTVDLDSIINGKPVKIKCKATKDRMRESQFIENAILENSGGIYIGVTDMDMFLQWYKSFTNVQVSTATI